MGNSWPSSSESRACSDLTGVFLVPHPAGLIWCCVPCRLWHVLKLEWPSSPHLWDASLTGMWRTQTRRPTHPKMTLVCEESPNAWNSPSSSPSLPLPPQVSSQWPKYTITTRSLATRPSSWVPPSVILVRSLDWQVAITSPSRECQSPSSPSPPPAICPYPLCIQAISPLHLVPRVAGIEGIRARFTDLLASILKVVLLHGSCLNTIQYVVQCIWHQFYFTMQPKVAGCIAEINWPSSAEALYSSRYELPPRYSSL